MWDVYNWHKYNGQPSVRLWWCTTPHWKSVSGSMPWVWLLYSSFTAYIQRPEEQGHRDTFILVVDSGTVFVPTARSADRLVWAWAEITLDAPPLARVLRSLPFHSPLAWDSRPVCPLYLQYYDKWFMLSLNQRLFSQHLAFKILWCYSIMIQYEWR